MLGSKKYAVQGLIIFSVAIGILLLWGFVVIPEFDKLNENYSLDIEYDAQTTMVDDVYGELKGPFFQRDVLSEKVIKVDGDIYTIQSSVTGTRIDTKEIMFQVKNIYKVDATTQMHIDKEGKRFGFLPGVKKIDYDFFHPAVFYDDPMIFKKTDTVNGLETFVFETITINADTSKTFSQFAPHEIHTDTTSRLWIEPITGNLVKFEKDWDNYLVEDGKRINTIQTGGKHTTEFSELILTQYTKAKIENITFNHFFIPIFLLVVIFGLGIIWIMLTYLDSIRQESRKKEQMSIIGGIVSRISHDLKNPLTIITTNTELIQNEKSTPEIKKKCFERILRGVNRMEYQINSIMDFVRKKPLQKENAQLSEILESSIENAQVPPTIQIKKNIPKISINVDVNQIDTVFSNIITNSVQAIGKGVISITVKEKENDIEIEFSDSGTGIPEDKIKDIFEPLFTTKQKGTGLGLASCKNIVEQHEGEISVKNNPTRFTIILPK